MDRNLTTRQHEVLKFIRRYGVERMMAPTIREMQEAFDFKSPQGVICHLEALERKGYIERGENQARAIRVLVQEPSGIPIVELSEIDSY